VRDIVKRHGKSVKVNTAFNEFATKDKHAKEHNYNTKNSEILYIDVLISANGTRAIRRRAYPSVVRRVPGTRQRVGIVANFQFGSECE